MGPETVLLAPLGSSPLPTGPNNAASAPPVVGLLIEKYLAGVLRKAPALPAAAMACFAPSTQALEKKHAFVLLLKDEILLVQKGFEVDWFVIEVDYRPKIMIRFRQTRTPGQDEEFDFETYDELVESVTDKQLKDYLVSEEDDDSNAFDDEIGH
eukprot:UC4_evm1s1387